MKPSHTATPWHTGEGAQSRIIYAPDGFAVADAAVFHGRHESSAEDNAAFIVRACNAHDDLVTDVKFLLEYFEDAIEYSGYNEDTKTKLRDRYKAILATLSAAEPPC